MAREILTPEERKRRQKIWSKRYSDSEKGRAKIAAYKASHKEERAESQRRYNQRDPEATRARKKIYYQNHKESLKKYYTERYISQREKILRKAHSDTALESQRQRKAKIRTQAMQALGGVCCRCGFSDPRALQIDHINGGGTKELRVLGNYAIQRKIISGNTDGYQLLCSNCNWIKRWENQEGGPRGPRSTTPEWKLPLWTLSES